MAIDRSIFRCCRILDISVHPGYPTEPTGRHQLLPRKYLSGYHQPKRFQFPPCRTTPILSTKLRSMGECTLVPELGHQSYLCSACDTSAAMGTKIPKVNSVALQSTQASPDPCVLFRRRRETSPSVGGRDITDASPHFSVPVLLWPSRLSIERQSHYLQAGAVMGQRLRGSVRMRHIDANHSS